MADDVTVSVANQVASITVASDQLQVVLQETRPAITVSSAVQVGEPLLIPVTFVIPGNGITPIVAANQPVVNCSYPFAGTITSWTILGDDPTGSCVIDVWKVPFGSYASASVANSITGTDKPTLVSASSNRNLTLSLWTTNVSASDILFFKVVSCSGHTQLNLVLGIS